jgi:hypothetical protein
VEIFPIAKEDGHAIGFEIEHLFITRGAIARLLKSIEHVTNVRVTGHFGSADESRVRFTYRDRDFMVWEPYGDNSRYAIAPTDPDKGPSDLTDIVDAFKRYRPLRALLNDLHSSTT